MSTTIETGNAMFDTFYERIKSFLEQDVSEYAVDGTPVRGYRSPDTTAIWLRDHTHQMKGFKYFEHDMKSAVDYFMQRQMPDGSLYDYVNAEGRNHRVPSESDVEYLFIEAAYTIWQVTGDDEWIAQAITPLQEALYHSVSDPMRWSAAHQMVKRPFTIDTWDFVYNPDGIYRWGSYGDVDANSTYCVMHGDNTGMHQSCRMFSKLCCHAGFAELGEYWDQRADRFKERVNEVCWNGRFLKHQVHIDPVEVRGVDESRQLSLSNAYALNRGSLSHEQCVSIIEEYIRRREETKGEYFAEWFSIHPPFPDSSFHSSNKRTGWIVNKGDYINGGVLPIVGGELARGAFENGFEEYGMDILRRYYDMIADTNETYLWYHPDGSPGISSSTTLATDGWGSAAMLCAFMEGIVGVRDEFKQFRKVRLSPRWETAGVTTAKVTVAYAASDSEFSYEYRKEKDTIALSWSGDAEEIDFHILLPGEMKGVSVTSGDAEVECARSRIRSSDYVDFQSKKKQGGIEIRAV